MEQSFEYYTVEPTTLADVKRLDNVKSASFSRDSDSQTLGSATIDVTNSFGESYIRGYLKTVQNGVTEKFPLGTVLSQTPSSSFDGMVTNVSMDCYTPLIELKEKPLPLGYTVRKGTRIMDAAYDLVSKNCRVPVNKIEPIIKKSKNLLNLGNRTVGKLSGSGAGVQRQFEFDKYYPGLARNNNYISYGVDAGYYNVVISNNDISCTIIYNGVGLPIEVEPNTKYTISIGEKNDISILSISYFDKQGYYISDYSTSKNIFTVTTPENCYVLVVVFRLASGVSSGDVYYKNIQVEKGSVATEYEPWFETEDLSPTLQYDFVSNTNDTVLSFVTDLIANAKYELGLGEKGNILFLPKQELESIQPIWTFDDSNSSILLPEITVNHDLYGIPNKVEVIYSYGGDYKEAVAINDDPNSPTSTVSRGRTIPYRDTSPSLRGYQSQEQIDAYAERLLKELSTLEYTVSYTHAYCPVRIGDCVRLNYTRAGITGIKAKVISQNIKAEPGCQVSEKAVFKSKLWR